MNKVILTGRIANDLMLNKTQSNKSVLNFAIAVNKGTKDENGNKQVVYIDIQSWGQQAEFLSQYAEKGVLIGVVGRVESSTYTAKDGNKVKRTYVVSENVEILNKPNKREPLQTIKRENNNFGTSFTEIADEDLPFI